MLKKFLVLALIPFAVFIPTLARAGGVTTLALDSTTTAITTLDDATINFTYACSNWASGGTVQLYIEGTTPTNIESPVTIPNITVTSYQFSGSITHRFTVPGTYVVNAKVVGTVDSVSLSYCDVPAVNSGTPVTIVVSAPPATTIATPLATETPQTGINTAGVVAFAALLTASGAVLARRRRLS